MMTTRLFNAVQKGALMLALLLGGAYGQAQAATYYVRPDGGTSVQCNGTSDAAYPGSGNHQACAWNSLMEALPPKSYNQNNPALIQGGDTLVIDSGTYMVGWSPSAVGEWGDNVCDAAYAPGCVPQAIPSGTAGQPTRIVGAGWDSGCANPPHLWGTQGANQVLDLDGSSHVVVACLDLTDHSECTTNYGPDSDYSCVNKAGTTGTTPPHYGPWADKALHAQDSSDITLQDLDIHGFADMGVQAGRISDWTVTRVKVRGNGEVGWNGDLGGNNHNSTNSGTLTFTDLDVSWNGCQETYPVDGTYINCFGQNEGGYGDGFAEAWTGGAFVFVRPVFEYNTQDGLDLLYANGAGSISVDRGLFGYNAGNDLKTSGNATVTNSLFIAWCNAMQDSGMAIAGDGSSGVSGTMCRAGGASSRTSPTPGSRSPSPTTRWWAIRVACTAAMPLRRPATPSTAAMSTTSTTTPSSGCQVHCPAQADRIPASPISANRLSPACSTPTTSSGRRATRRATGLASCARIRRWSMKRRKPSMPIC